MTLALLTATAAAPLVSPLVAQQPVQVPASGPTLSFDFTDADIRAVIAAIAEAGRINYTANDVSPKRISLHVRRPDGSAAAIALLRAVVRANSLYMTERDGMYLISSLPPLSDTSSMGSPLVTTDTELFVYRLRHANATQLAQILQAIFNGAPLPMIGPGLTRSTLSQSLSQSMQGQAFNLGGGGGGFNLGGGGLNRLLGLGGGNQAQPGQQQQRQGPGGGAQGAAPAGPRIVIVPENSTNSLLVRTDSADWLRVKQAIEAVDLRPRQVLIEVMIAEVQRTDNLDVGIGSVASNQRTFKGRSLGTAHLPVDTSAGNSFIFDLTRYGAVDINIALKALQSRGNVRVLSRPLIFAENNVESSLLVGSQQPFIQSFQTFATTPGAQNQIVQYQSVGTSLAILPTINPDGYVNLQVQQEVSNATNQIQFGAPVISTREASASLFVKDGQTVVVGGLANTQEQHTRSGIPILSQIPVIGGLFGSTSTSNVRTELFLFLTPHVVQADSDVSRILNAVHDKTKLLHDVPVTPYILPQDSGAVRRAPVLDPGPIPVPPPAPSPVPPGGTGAPVQSMPLSRPQ